MIDHKNRKFTIQDIITDSFKKRTPMYTGELTLKSIFIYLNAYSYAMYDVGYENSHYLSEYHFNEFVQAYCGFNSSTAGWHKMIIAYFLGYDKRMVDWSWNDIGKAESNMSKDEHEASINLFYTLFDKFYTLTPREYYTFIISKSFKSQNKLLDAGKQVGCSEPYHNSEKEQCNDIIAISKYLENYIVYYSKRNKVYQKEFLKAKREKSYSLFKTLEDALFYIESLDRHQLFWFNEIKAFDEEEIFNLIKVNNQKIFI